MDLGANGSAVPEARGRTVRATSHDTLTGRLESNLFCDGARLHAAVARVQMPTEDECYLETAESPTDALCTVRTPRHNVSNRSYLGSYLLYAFENDTRACKNILTSSL